MFTSKAMSTAAQAARAGAKQTLSRPKATAAQARVFGPIVEDHAPADHPYLTRMPGDEAHIWPRVHPVVWPSDRVAEASSGPLSETQLQSYATNGYLMRRNVFSSDEVDHLIAEADTLYNRAAAAADGDKVTATSRSVTEPQRNGAPPAVRSVFAPHRTSLLVNRAQRDARMVDAAKQVLDDDVFIHQSRVNFQRAIHGTGFFWHSDIETWMSEDGLPRPQALSQVILLSRNRSTNGALMLVPGSHRFWVSCPGETPDANWETSLKAAQQYGTPTGEQLETLVNAFGIEFAEGDPGDVLMFDCNTLHASANNLSPTGRCNVFGVYNAVSNNAVGDKPPAASTFRPEHIACRDPQWCQPSRPVDNSVSPLTATPVGVEMDFNGDPPMLHGERD